jgi:hypothetical protein
MSGASARRVRGEAGYAADPYADWCDLEPDDATPDYWKLSGGSNTLEADDYTVWAIVRPEDFGSNVYPVALYSSTSNRSWEISVTSIKILSCRSTANACSSSTVVQKQDSGWNSSVDALVALTFDYSGNPGSSDSTMRVWVIRSGATSGDVNASVVGPVIDCTADFTVGTRVGLEASASYDGRIYAVGYNNAVLSQTNLEDIFNGTDHPVDDYPSLQYYVDFSDSDGFSGTYTPEVGEGDLTAFGNPVQGSV